MRSAMCSSTSIIYRQNSNVSGTLVGNGIVDNSDVVGASPLGAEGNSPVTDEFPAQKASNAENVSIWWRHHAVWNECWGVDLVTFIFADMSIR